MMVEASIGSAELALRLPDSSDPVAGSHCPARSQEVIGSANSATKSNDENSGRQGWRETDLP